MINGDVKTKGTVEDALIVTYAYIMSRTSGGPSPKTKAGVSEPTWSVQNEKVSEPQLSRPFRFGSNIDAICTLHVLSLSLEVFPSIHSTFFL